MTFENVAYLFDTAMLGAEKSPVYGVLSFVGNPLYIPTYAKDAIEKYDFIKNECEDMSQWFRNPDNSDSIFSFLMKLHEDVEKLGISSFFIEKDYSVFIYLMGLMVTDVRVEDTNFRIYLDKLYFSYQSAYNDEIKRGSLSEIVTNFNERIQHLIQTQKNHQFFRSMLSEHGRKLNEQIALLQIVEHETKSDFIAADYFFYAKQLVKTYKEKGVHDIYASSNVAKRFSEATGRFYNSAEDSLNVRNRYDDDFETVSQFARIILLISNYYVGKIVDTKSIQDLDDLDKYLFVVVWMILHGGDNNMFINGRSYEVIREVFLSLKKDMDI